MLNSNLNNSFNIHSENIREPNLVNDEEVSISTYIHNSKGFYFYNQDLGLENKNVLELTLLELSNLNSQVTKIDGNFEKEIMLNYFQSELLRNGFSNFTVSISDDFQTRSVNVNLDKNYLNNRSDVING